MAPTFASTANPKHQEVTMSSRPTYPRAIAALQVLAYAGAAALAVASYGYPLLSVLLLVLNVAVITHNVCVTRAGVRKDQAAYDRIAKKYQ